MMVVLSVPRVSYKSNNIYRVWNSRVNAKAGEVGGLWVVRAGDTICRIMLR